MAQRIDSTGGGSLHIAYDAGGRSVTLSATDRNGNRSSLRLAVDDFDKITEQYMYLRQFGNGRRAR